MSELWEQERSAFIAVEIGGAVIELVAEGVMIGRDTILERLDDKYESIGNMIHKSILREASEYVRKGRSRSGKCTHKKPATGAGEIV